MRWPQVVALAGALGCGTTPEPPRSPEITGTLTVDGTSLAVSACRPGRGVGTFVEVVAREGVLRFEDKRLTWSSEPLTCDQLDRSWGGGSRADGSAYWRGTLVFRCKAGARTVTGDLDLDCGNITPEERRQLDGQRTDLREEQRKARAAGSAGPDAPP